MRDADDRTGKALEIRDGRDAAVMLLKKFSTPELLDALQQRMVAAIRRTHGDSSGVVRALIGLVGFGGPTGIAALLLAPNALVAFFFMFSFACVGALLCARVPAFRNRIRIHVTKDQEKIDRSWRFLNGVMETHSLLTQQMKRDGLLNEASLEKMRAMELRAAAAHVAALAEVAGYSPEVRKELAAEGLVPALGSGDPPPANA